jgi:hypothetical protein
MCGNRYLNKIVSALAVLILASFSGVIRAHGGGSGIDADSCRIAVGSHWVHFTAYQPQLAGTTEYCKAIPDVGQSTLVFDYEGKALRRMTVEFEITREPDGTRMYYQPPTIHPSGSTNATINFTEPGNYLAHVTLINEGQKVDAHVPFSVGTAQAGPSLLATLAITMLVLAVIYILYLTNVSFKGTVDRLRRKPAGSGTSALKP